MLDEEVIVKDAKNGSERMLILNVILMVLMPAVLFGGNSDLATGLFIALGILAPLNVINYKRIWIDAPNGTIPLYFLSLLPCIISLVIAVIGIFNEVLIPSEEGAKGFFSLDISNTALIVSASESALSTLTSELVSLSAIACALSLFFITDSRYIIRRIFFFCVIGAAIIAVFGFTYNVLKMIPNFILPSFGDNAFATFTDASQWSAFAILWLAGALTIAAYSAQRYRVLTFLYSLKFISLLSALILLLSILSVGTPIERVFALLVMSISCAIICADTIPTKKNLERHWTSKYVHSKYKKLKLSIAPIIYAIISLTSICAGIIIGLNSYNNPDERMLLDKNDTSQITILERTNILEDVQPLIELRPQFGWGSGSFMNVFSFRQGADLGDTPYQSPKSDIIQKLVENGYIGFALTTITPLIFLIRWLIKRTFSKSGIILFATSILLLILAIFDNPMQSIAVLQSFWIIIIGLFKWDDCEVK